MSAVLVNTIISNALQTASEAVNRVGTATQAAQTASLGYGGVGMVEVGYAIGAVEPPIPVTENSTLTFEAQRDRVVALLSNELTGFFAKYYPLAADAFDEATNWLVNSITVGGTGINPAVEAQIWQRDRDRVTADGLRAESQTQNEFAMRGFSLPSGALAARLQQVRFEQLAKTQEQSRDVAIKQADIEIANVRFAVEQAIQSRFSAMQAAAEYLRALMSGVDSAVRVASLNVDARARAMSATADLYRARLARDELALKIPFANQEVGLRAQISNIENFYKGIDTRVAAAVSAAEAHGKVAAAALSSLSSIASTTVAANA